MDSRRDFFGGLTHWLAALYLLFVGRDNQPSDSQKITEGIMKKYAEPLKPFSTVGQPPTPRMVIENGEKGDIIFYDGNGNEMMRLWGNGSFSTTARNGSGTFGGTIITTGDVNVHKQFKSWLFDMRKS